MRAKSVLEHKLGLYYKRYYGLRIMRGVFFSVGVAMAALLLLGCIEYFSWFPTGVRTFLWYGYLLTLCAVAAITIILPSLQWLGWREREKWHKAAKEIGGHFREIDDKLTNALDLEGKSNKGGLLKAALRQKEAQLINYDFREVVTWGLVRRAWPVLALPLVATGIFWLSGQENILKEGTNRIINHRVAYAKTIPFDWLIEGRTKILEGEDIVLNFLLKDGAQVDEVIAKSGNKVWRFSRVGNAKWQLQMKGVQQGSSMELYAGGYFLREMDIEVLPMPEVGSTMVEFRPPPYTDLANEKGALQQVLRFPEGTELIMKTHISDGDSVVWHRGNVTRSSQRGEIDLGKQREEYSYDLRVYLDGRSRAILPKGEVKLIKDRRPQINVAYEQGGDSLLQYASYEVADDYGLEKVELRLIKRSGKQQLLKSRKLFLQKEALGVFTLSADSLRNFAQAGDYLQLWVWDNDGINGSKAARSEVFLLGAEELQSAEERRQENMAELINASKKAQSSLRELEETLRSLRSDVRDGERLSWEKKKELRDKMDRLNETLKQHRRLKKNQEKSETEQGKKELERRIGKDKKEEEIRKLLEEINELLEENDMKKLQQKMEALQKQASELSKSAQIEEQLLKDLRFERDVLKELERLEQMRELMDKEEQRNADEDGDSDMEEFKKQLEAHEDKMEDLERQREVLSKELEEQYEKGKEKARGEKTKENGSKSDHKSQQKQDMSEGAKEMKEALSQSLSMMQAAQQKKNMESLQSLLDNLEIFSEGVEEAGEFTRAISTDDPLFRKILLEKKKLMIGSAIIRDSLEALAMVAPEIEDVVFEELNSMEHSLERSMELMQETEFGKSAGRDRFSMTAANNLALLLDQSLQQMQANMASMMQSKANCSKPGNNPKPGAKGKKLGELGKQVESLKGKKPGEGLSREIMKIIKEQEALRQTLKGDEKGKGSGNGEEPGEVLNDIEKALLERDWDYPFKERYKEIETRLLESDEAERKRGREEKRQAEQATEALQQRKGSEKLELFEKKGRMELWRSSLRVDDFYRKE